MIRSVAIALALAAIPAALAQTPRQSPAMTSAQAQVDPAAIYNFDLDGGQGIPLTKDIIRSYLSAPIARPAPELTRAAYTRVRVAEAGRSAILSGDDLFTPLWEEQAFELQDGSIRPMTSVERAAFAELDAAEAASRSLRRRPPSHISAGATAPPTPKPFAALSTQASASASARMAIARWTGT
ncbi:MAG TPA: hypothetical protein VGO52_10180 [Hyphomonadaceae bacterium]|nr:hypothetical protein [Hyphomonadaceae bacterium]